MVEVYVIVLLWESTVMVKMLHFLYVLDFLRRQGVPPAKLFTDDMVQFLETWKLKDPFQILTCCVKYVIGILLYIA